MRLTLDVDDDVLAAARAVARSESRSLGAVISELARLGLAWAARRIDYEDGFPVFRVAPGTPPLTGEVVREALDSGG